MGRGGEKLDLDEVLRFGFDLEVEPLDENGLRPSQSELLSKVVLDLFSASASNTPHDMKLLARLLSQKEVWDYLMSEEAPETKGFTRYQEFWKWLTERSLLDQLNRTPGTALANLELAFGIMPISRMGFSDEFNQRKDEYSDTALKALRSNLVSTRLNQVTEGIENRLAETFNLWLCASVTSHFESLTPTERFQAFFDRHDPNIPHTKIPDIEAVYRLGDEVRYYYGEPEDLVWPDHLSLRMLSQRLLFKHKPDQFYEILCRYVGKVAARAWPKAASSFASTDYKPDLSPTHPSIESFRFIKEEVKGYPLPL